MNARKLCTIVVVILFSTSLAYAQLTTSQIVKKYSPSVVTIVALDANDQPISLGSGFFINANGDIATNHHVLQGSAKAIIKTSDNKKGEIVEIINDDTELDLLIAKTSLKTTNPLPLGDSDTITVGEEIIAIGNPAGLEGTVSNGIISGIRKVEGFKFIQITAPISPGSSGGPVFDKAGRVIGIATAYLDTGQNLNFAMPVNYLKSLKQSKGKLASLVKNKVQITSGDKLLVEASEIRYDRCGSSLCGIDFLLSNNSNYSIRNIKLLIIYKRIYTEFPAEYGRLWDKYEDERDKTLYEQRKQYLEEAQKYTTPIKTWDKVLSYSADILKNTILPKLALQFGHKHIVHHCDNDRDHNIVSYCVAEIRVLDYEIDRTVGNSPMDLLFK